MLDLERSLERMTAICGNALFVLALAAASVWFSHDGAAPRASAPEGWRAPQRIEATVVHRAAAQSNDPVVHAWAATRPAQD